MKINYAASSHETVTTTFGYDKVSNWQSVTRQTSTGTVFSTTGYTYDSLNRLSDIVNRDGNNAIMSYYHYLLRADGKRSSVTHASATTSYPYDDQGKLTQEAGPYATIAYTYDNVGNRLTRTVTNAALVQLLTNGDECPADYLGCPRTVTIRSLNFV